MSIDEKRQSMSKVLMGKYTLRIIFPADDAVPDKDVPQLKAAVSEALREFARCWEEA